MQGFFQISAAHHLKSMPDKRTNNIFQVSAKNAIGFITLIHVTKNKNYCVVHCYHTQ
jgi:hypothetical protein